MPTPVILDTDVGTDIDDSWAIVQLLKSPGLDCRALVTAHGDTEARARIAAKLLEAAGRSDIPVGIGVPSPPDERSAGGLPQAAWAEGYTLADYPGRIAEDGVGLLLEAAFASSEPPCIVSIGPLTNVAAALAREPRLAGRARFVGMQGSVHLGYRQSADVVPEYNVRCDVEAARRVFAADWSVTLTPLDTCGLVYLKGDLYQSVRAGHGPALEALFENYRAWLTAVGAPAERIESKSTTLYDCVAVYLAESEVLLEIEELGIRLDDAGKMHVDAEARPLRVATRWKSLEAFHEWLAERLLS